MGRKERRAAEVALGDGLPEGGVQVGVFDCQACGACCVNSEENRAEGYPWYVEVEDRRSPLLRVPDLKRSYVVADPAGRPHLRLDGRGRCLALGGALGRAVACAVYEHRPANCRRVIAGDADCVRARVEQGLVPPGAEAPPGRKPRRAR